MTVVLDIQGTQSRDHADRGIARYLRETATALMRVEPDAVSSFALNPDLPPPRHFEELAATGRIVRNDAGSAENAQIYHVGSPFEHVPFDRLWPRFARGGRRRLVVTVYDLIPELFPALYLRNPVIRRSYHARLELIRQADRILAISQATANDVVTRLRIPSDRVDVVGAGVGAEFSPPTVLEEARATASDAVPGLEHGYVLYTGGIEPRKNVERLLAAYARLPERLRTAHQLVIVCRVTPDERLRLDEELARLGIAQRVLFPGYVEDSTLVALYQACQLFVFPSLYEGFGLPVAEALACGAPVIAARTSSLPELVDDAALFDPYDVDAIAHAVIRALEDERLRTRLRSPAVPTWDEVAARIVAAYRRVDPPRRRRSRPRVAFVTPLPPQPSGVADASFHLLEAFRERCPVDVFVDGPSTRRPVDVAAPAGLTVASVASFERCDGIRDYDQIVYCLGNSEFHVGALALLQRRPGVVIAHDLRLSGLYTWAARNRPDLATRIFHESLHAMYGDRLPTSVGEHGWLDVDDADRYGIYMARDVIRASTRFLVHSRYAAQLARLEAAPEDAEKIGVLPFGVAAPANPRCEDADEPLIATFGIAAAAKQIEKVVRAFARLAEDEPSVRLAFVGSFPDPTERKSIERLARDLGVAERTVLTGRLDASEYGRWLARATIALQLRSWSNGETSGAVMDCLAAGVPTIATGIGAAAELPDRCVVKVPAQIAPDVLAAALRTLLREPKERLALSTAAATYARTQSFDRAAAALYDVVMAEHAESTPVRAA